MAAAAIAAAAIGAAGSIGGSVISSQGAKSAAAAARPSTHKFPIPAYARALQQQVARAYALNMGAVPPSFGSYVGSGGTELFPWKDPGISPVGAWNLGLTTKRGQPVTWAQGGTEMTLSPEQKLFMGMQLSDRPDAQNNPLVRAWRLNKRISRISEKHPEKQQRLEKLRTRRDDLLNLPNTSGGLA